MAEPGDETGGMKKRRSRSMILGPSPYDVIAMVMVAVMGGLVVISIVVRWVRG
jgi:hypothetical protein